MRIVNKIKKGCALLLLGGLLITTCSSVINAANSYSYDGWKECSIYGDRCVTTYSGYGSNGVALNVGAASMWVNAGGYKELFGKGTVTCKTGYTAIKNLRALHEVWKGTESKRIDAYMWEKN